MSKTESYQVKLSIESERVGKEEMSITSHMNVTNGLCFLELRQTVMRLSFSPESMQLSIETKGSFRARPVRPEDLTEWMNRSLKHQVPKIEGKKSDPGFKEAMAKWKAQMRERSESLRSTAETVIHASINLCVLTMVSRIAKRYHESAIVPANRLLSGDRIGISWKEALASKVMSE